MIHRLAVGKRNTEHSAGWTLVWSVLWAGGEQSANTAEVVSTHLVLFWVNWLNNYPQAHLSSGTSLAYLGFFNSEDGREEEPGEVIYDFSL